MQTRLSFTRVLAAVLLATTSMAGVAAAQTAEQKFHEAYYLEEAARDFAAAESLYAQVVGDRSADADLRARAGKRASGCREEIASRDFARLMPPETILYAELQRPGEQLMSLLEQLGLLANEDSKARRGRVAISPALVLETIGIGGAAIAITSFDPQHDSASGVAIFNPGNLGAVRGLIETGLPIGGEPVDPIAGFATYAIEGEAFVTLTSRLVIVSDERTHIEGVVRRLAGDDARSFADNEDIRAALADRDDALLYFCVRAEPLLPMLHAAMKAGGPDAHELAVAQALLDFDSFETLTGHIGVSDDGLALAIGLHVKEGHQNLIYNFLRTPAINRDTMRCVPQGAAAVVLGALNEAPSRYNANAAPTEELAIVTGMDFGREFFANIVGFALFALPPEGQRAAGMPPIPDVGAVFTVIDPSQSEALWMQVLGVASLAAGAPGVEGDPTRIENTDVRSFRFPEGVTMYIATADHDVVLATSESAMARTLVAKRTGRSILQDDEFAVFRSRLTPSTTKAIFIHPTRCLQIARPFMSKNEAAEIEPVIGVLADTAISAVVDHSGTLLRFAVSVSGIPDVRELVSTAIEQELHGQHGRSQHAKGDGENAASIGARLLRKEFDRAVKRGDDSEAVQAMGKALCAMWKEDPTALNNFAWALLTDEQYDSVDAQLALTCATRSNELTGMDNWMFLDTLALASFKTGDIARAIELEKHAIERGEGEGGDSLKATRARFEKALSDGTHSVRR